MARRYQKIENKIKVLPSLIKDVWFIYSLRTDKQLRERSFSKKKISKKEHQRWFRDFLKRNYSYTIFLNRERVGNVRFEKIKKSLFSVGMAILPEFSGRGIGSLALKTALKKIEKKEKKATIIAEVKKENIKARKFFEKNGFKLSYFGYQYET